MSAQPKFTPGPWKWWTSCSWRRLSSEARGHNKDGGVLCPTVSRSDGHPDVIVSDADMALIAAAPEMYEACQALCIAYPEDEDDNAFELLWARYGSALAYAVQSARLALAKAEGRQP